MGLKPKPNTYPNPLEIRVLNLHYSISGERKSRSHEISTDRKWKNRGGRRRRRGGVEMENRGRAREKEMVRKLTAVVGVQCSARLLRK